MNRQEKLISGLLGLGGLCFLAWPIIHVVALQWINEAILDIAGHSLSLSETLAAALIVIPFLAWAAAGSFLWKTFMLRDQLSSPSGPALRHLIQIDALVTVPAVLVSVLVMFLTTAHKSHPGYIWTGWLMASACLSWVCFRWKKETLFKDASPLRIGFILAPGLVFSLAASWFYLTPLILLVGDF